MFFIFFRIKCTRCVNNIQTKLPPVDSDCTNDLSCWYHCSDKRWVVDPVLKQCWNAGITMVFYQHSTIHKEVIHIYSTVHYIILILIILRSQQKIRP